MVVDTDVILRYLTKDDPEKAKAFKRFLESGQKITLIDITFAETYWTLKSFYGFSKSKILKGLESLINHSSISCNHQLLKQTIQILKQHNISFIDAYTASYSLIHNDQQVLSFDQGFDKISEIKRKEP